LPTIRLNPDCPETEVMLKYRNNARLMSRAMLGRRAAADCPQKCSSSLSDSLFLRNLLISGPSGT